MSVRLSLKVGALAALSTITLGLVSATVAEAQTPNAVTPDSISGCTNTTPPSWFYDIATNAAQADSSIPDSWGTNHDLARIVCFESSYNTHAENPNGLYFGLGQMGKSQISDAGVSWDHYWNGSADHHIAYYQLLAAMRYCKSRYGTPAAGWTHEVNYNWW